VTLVTAATAMSEQEHSELRALVKQDGFALRATARISERYGVSDAQATEVLNAVCNSAIGGANTSVPKGI
jgi:hypothetical protein